VTWRTRAACAGHPTPLWDESVFGETRKQQVARHHAAIAICGTCPVSSHCLADVDWSVDEGVRGGRLLPFKKTAYRARSNWPAYARRAAAS
jgi:hypothetical protein